MNGSNSRFDDLYREYMPKLFKAAVSILDNRALAEEMVQDVFVVFLLHQKELEHHENLPAWLFRTLRNKILSELQRLKYAREEPLGPEHDSFTAVFDKPFSKLADALPKGLTESEREVLILFFEEGFAHEEIAQKLGISVRASQGRLYRAKSRYITLMSQEDQGAAK